MRITATQIEQWGATREAQGLLPILIRRLIGASSNTTALVIPGGDSIVSPGWDGCVEAANGNAWVPQGPSYWEFGCAGEVGRKASADFNKRTKQTAAVRAAASSFLFVSPRRWRQKSFWRARALKKGRWQDVRAYDADDLEGWIESVGSVALWFAEQLGLAGPGIESPSACWSIWEKQTSLPINAEAFLLGREAAKATLLDVLSKKPKLIGVEADSSDEAAAFVAVVLETHGLGSVAACITSEEGWRFCDANTQISIGVATSPEVASRRALREGFTLVVPLSTADRRNQLMGSAARAADEQQVLLERQRSERFEEAMRLIGEEPADATRLSRATGRSWSVYRRLRARNPAIRRPAWLKGPASRALAAITLVGSWSGDKAGDRACLEAISGQAYEELEANLRHLARLDDPPVLQIGSVWKAKAPIDLLYLVGPELTEAQLDRFFTTAEAILTKPDPALELENEKRWAAAVYGKVRDESGLVIDAIVDSLAKLSVYAEGSTNSHIQRIQNGVAVLVRRLLHDADGERWLSLAGILRELAEAAPSEFLDAIECSMRRPDQSVKRLVAETADSGSMGRCWHADLLWAMEVLAWSPSRLAKVCICLAPFVDVPVKGNWANTPLHTLISFFRPWWPQTAADVSQRVAVLDRLIAEHEGVAWQLLFGLVPSAIGDWASANAKPRWRDDDAGTSEHVRSDEYGNMLSEVGLRVLAQAKGHPDRISKLIGAMDNFEGAYKESLIELAESAKGFGPIDREAVRAAVRKYLNWHNSYNQKGDRKSRSAVSRLRKLFDELASESAIERHAWLFSDGWADLPDGREEDFKKQEEWRDLLRGTALLEILAEGGLNELVHLAEHSGNPWLVGLQTARAELDVVLLATWMVGEFRRAGAVFQQPMISGILCGSATERRSQLLKSVTYQLASPIEVAALLSCLPAEPETWSLLETQSVAVQAAYWKSIRLGYVRGCSEDLHKVVEQLLSAGRPCTAFQAVHAELKVVAPEHIVAMLDGIRAGLETNGPLPRGWNIGEAIGVAKASGTVPRRTLALLEFAFYQALKHDQHGVPNLYAEILGDPALFLELICLVFKKQDGPDQPIDESRKPAAQLAWSVLHYGRGTPGTSDGKIVDAEAFSIWVAAVREGARSHDRSKVADSTLGQWLSSCPSDLDGSWPCGPVRDLLEQEDAEHMRDGFGLGIRNNRGMTSRMPDEGGGQERALVKRYKDIADALRNSHPRLADELDQVAAYYKWDAQREDWDAQLNIERY